MRYLNAPNPAFGEDRQTYKVGTNANASDSTFNVSYDSGRVSVFLNGVKLHPTDDYTYTTSGVGTSVTLVSQIGASNVLELIGYQGVNTGNNVAEDRFVVGTNSSGSGGSYTGSTTVFNVSSNSGDLVSVWRNGIKLVLTTDFTVDASASTVTLGSAASSADEITVQVVGILNHVNVVPNQSSQSGKFLTTNGSAASWATVDALPSQSGNSGKYLTTNGSASSWSDLVFPAGHIIKHTGPITFGTGNHSTSSSSYVVFDKADGSPESVTVSYTAGNKLFIMWTVSGYAKAGGFDSGLNFRIGNSASDNTGFLTNSPDGSAPDGVTIYVGLTNSDQNPGVAVTVPFSIIDSPSGTSTTYYLQHKASAGGDSVIYRQATYCNIFEIQV